MRTKDPNNQGRLRVLRAYRNNPTGGIDKKKSKAGKIGRGGNAFEPKKTKKKKNEQEQARIELVVRMAREREKQGESGNAHDVVAHLPFKFNRKATKVA